MSTELLTEYDATLDTKRRFVVKGLPPFKHYHVRVYANEKGAITLKMEPQVLAKLDQLFGKYAAYDGQIHEKSCQRHCWRPC